MVVESMRSKGQNMEAARLLQAGRAGYPGSEEMAAFAEVLGGGIEVVPLLARDRHLQGPMQYGTGPLKLRVGQTLVYDPDGHGSPHYVLLQAWPTAAATSTRSPGTLPLERVFTLLHYVVQGFLG